MHRNWTVRLALLLLLVAAFPRSVESQSAPDASPLPMPRKQFLGADGKPLAYGKVYTYLAGTSTPQVTYTDSTAMVTNPTTITLDAGGYASIYIKCTDPPYKIVLKSATGVLQWTEDGVGYPDCSGGGGGGGLTWSNEEGPSGTLNGVNVTFTLAHSPSPATSLRLIYNGLTLRSGAGNDFTLSGLTITMAYAPTAGSNLIAWYTY